MRAAFAKFATAFGIVLLPSLIAVADDVPPDRYESFARKVSAITSAVLDHHIDPPSRQHMLESGARHLRGELLLGNLPKRLEAEMRIGLLASDVVNDEQIRTFLEEVWPREWDEPIEQQEERFIEGLLSAVPGPSVLMSESENRAREQFAGNRYVGIHIAVSFDEGAGLVRIHDVFKGGPAARAGIRSGDLIESIDGDDMEGVELREVVERLRGEEGTTVEVTVRSSRKEEPRTLEIVRGTLPRETVQIPETAWLDEQGRLDPVAPIAYLKIETITGSTLHELRQHEARLRTAGFRALVLDLQPCDAEDFHPALLLADALLDGGPIGRVRTVGGVREYRAEPEALFRGWPLAVIIGRNTVGPAEWLASALQDNDRAVLIGQPTAGQPRVSTAVALPEDFGWLVLQTTLLERADGRRIVERLEPAMPFGPPMEARLRRDRFGVSPDEGKMVRTGGADLHLDAAGRPIDSPDRSTPIERAVEVLRLRLDGTL